ncbi:hypothetical protein KUTeg_018100 [Tegillarca granosa]|uniref:NTF2 domain-containing protein n=1 Tax=Tegillarca granosa TaxID=220873 RepID=A0ABQ9EKQ6_TEGGR|nr:hypothetical protein KUTeg_018100 [Tegillarca granosa]
MQKCRSYGSFPPLFFHFKEESCGTGCYVEAPLKLSFTSIRYYNFVSMNEKERKGCYELLQLLGDAELFSLAETITKKQIKVNTRKDAFKAVVTYSESSLELLKRKKLKRDVLFQYLAIKNIVVPVNADKSTIIQKILTLWEVKDRPTLIKIENDDSFDGKDNSCSSPLNRGQKCETSDQQVQTPPDNAGTSRSQDFSNSPINHQNAQVQTSSLGSANGHPPCVVKEEATSSSTNFESTSQQLPCDNNKELTVAGSGNVSDHPSCSDINSQGQSATASGSHPEQGQGEYSSYENKQKLGENFARWFFKLLNSHNSETSETPDDFGPHHFWDDAKLMVECHTPNFSSDLYSGSDLISERLLAFVKEEHLVFNPNISKEGVFVRSSPHGMMIVLVCGTIHRGNGCLGTYEQMFGLVADPRLNDNWKIKIVKLKLQSEQVTAIPKLTSKSDNEIKALIAV